VCHLFIVSGVLVSRRSSTMLVPASGRCTATGPAHPIYHTNVCSFPLVIFVPLFYYYIRSYSKNLGCKQRRNGETMLNVLNFARNGAKCGLDLLGKMFQQSSSPEKN